MRQYRRYRLKRKYVLRRALLIAAALLLAVGLFALGRWAVGALTAPGPAEPAGPAQPDPAPVDPVEPQAPQLREGDTTVSTPRANIHRGDLILVGSQNAYEFPEQEPYVSVYENKTSSYKVRDRNVRVDEAIVPYLNAMFDEFYAATGVRDVIVVSGERSYDSQKNLYDKYLAEQGEQYVREYVATPGYSEHHSGLAVDLSIYKSDGTMHNYTDEGDYSWIIDNACLYGFVRRYPDDKVAVTGVSYEPWHFRYVGRAHACLMQQRGLCLEEYLELLRQYPYEGEHLIFDDSDGSRYEIYYVEAEAEGETQLPVPQELAYTVSGDNAGGFVVTVKTA
ncbi:M15 family metallopeptidase [Feifania hominis]|uniref:M15 family metallopeptidase n=1 Tax=Feifania hominis TaxID=2763660 RepID=A0A926DDY6_9FIRM|nr:M15 family metallopeptidase [Feifania hominis]MBC8536338.1 M15 family metallopeptidase [Feifania hominis]